MIEVFGDLWTYEADACVITTNGAVRNDGAAVMGRGCARQAKELFPGIEYSLGQFLDQFGNHVGSIWLAYGKTPILSFPVKEHWAQVASLALIEQSAIELRATADLQQLELVVMPRPGCGNGRLQWEDVQPVLDKYLDDRFHVITNTES